MFVNTFFIFWCGSFQTSIGVLRFQRLSFHIVASGGHVCRSLLNRWVLAMRMSFRLHACTALICRICRTRGCGSIRCLAKTGSLPPRLRRYCRGSTLPTSRIATVAWRDTGSSWASGLVICMMPRTRSRLRSSWLVVRSASLSAVPLPLCALCSWQTVRPILRWNWLKVSMWATRTGWSGGFLRCLNMSLVGFHDD